MKYGAHLTTKRPVELKFGAVFDVTQLPTPPMDMGRSNVVKAPWKMLLNDKKSCCVISGYCHETMQLGATAGHTIPFSDPWVLKDYNFYQGNKWWPFNDGGLDMEAAANTRRTTGVHDANGIRHRIKAYLDLPLGNARYLALAVWYLRVAGVGLNLPKNAQDLWASNRPWDDASLPPNGEGHYVPCIDRRANGNWIIITWGKEQEMSDAFYKRYNILSLAYLSFESLNAQHLTPEQWNEAKLTNFLSDLRRPA